jgi:hypothetical protein
MVGTIICEVGTIICDISIINVRFYLLKVRYPYEYCRITRERECATALFILGAMGGTPKKKVINALLSDN